MHPYAATVPAHPRLPATGIDRDELLAIVAELSDAETPRWADGFVSGGIYHGDREHVAFLSEVYTLQSQSNPLHFDLFPSTVKFENDVIEMVAHLFGKGATAPQVCGSVTSGGTESILLAMKTYRDRASVDRPNVVLPVTAHAAFDKAGHYFGIELRKAPVGADGVVEVAAMRSLCTSKTVALVASAPSFPHGVCDPVAEISRLAEKRRVGLHVDACLGGFVLPFASRLGRFDDSVDFSLPGVTSISVDTHKYGYAAKGTSVLLWRDPQWRQDQWFTITDWPGGLYFSPTLAGSRAGGVVAAAWASLLSVGEAGYLRATEALLDTAAWIKDEVATIADLEIIGDPLWVLAFRSTSPELPIYGVLDQMSERGWNLNGLQRPESFHLALTLRHTQSGVKERFIADLRDSVTDARDHGPVEGGMAPVYGMAANLPFRGLVSDMLKAYLDVIYRPRAD